ncbi:MAG TPA: BatD family protein, partial [Saprospiraceae bacterium]|nr:BatD family protein [Saprospiraceae bacterium]
MAILSRCPSSARLWLALMAGLWLCVPAVGQVSFEAKTELEEVVQGSRFDVAFVLTNAQGESFKMPALGGLKSRHGVTESFGTQFISGRGSTTQSWILHLEAAQTGSFTIGAASITVDDQVLSTKPLTIRVVKPRPIKGISVPPGSEGQVFLAQQFDPPQAVVGQQLTWRLLLCSRLPIEQGDDLLDLPDFAGFAHREKRHFDTHSRTQTIGGKKYHIRSLYEEALWPQEAGSLTVGQSAVRVFVERTDAIGAMMGPVPVVLRAAPAEYVVKPLPQPAPPGFSGAVGRYEWTVKTDKTELNTDDALTLSLSLSGNGQSQAISPAPLALPPGLEAFDPKTRDEAEQETSGGFTHRKVMEYAILPKQPGRYALWPEFVFYDPDSSRYRRLSPPDSLRIAVQPGVNY